MYKLIILPFAVFHPFSNFFFMYLGCELTLLPCCPFLPIESHPECCPFLPIESHLEDRSVALSLPFVSRAGGHEQPAAR